VTSLRIGTRDSALGKYVREIRLSFLTTRSMSSVLVSRSWGILYMAYEPGRCGMIDTS
jgi:hypothetical protein